VSDVRSCLLSTAGDLDADDNVDLMTTFYRRADASPRTLNYLPEEIANQMRVDGCRRDPPDTVRRGETDSATGHPLYDRLVLQVWSGLKTLWYLTLSWRRSKSEIIRALRMRLFGMDMGLVRLTSRT